jgi:hypothetical protein
MGNVMGMPFLLVKSQENLEPDPQRLELRRKMAYVKSFVWCACAQLAS